MNLQTVFYYSRMHFNLWKTLYLNFKCFRFEDAVKLPIFVYGHVGLEDLHKGCIKLQSVKTRTVRIGGGYCTQMFGLANLYRTHLKISGSLILGNNITIDQGCLISISKGGIIKIGNGCYINRNTKIHAKEYVELEDHCRVGWDSQIYDTNFHYTVFQGKVYKRNKPIILHHNVWLANDVTIAKGTVLPAYSVVAAKSLVNKDMSEYGEACLYGGTPAKFIAKDIRRLLGVEQQITPLFNDSQDYLVWEDIAPCIKDCFAPDYVD